MMERADRISGIWLCFGDGASGRTEVCSVRVREGIASRRLRSRRCVSSSFLGLGKIQKRGAWG